MFRLLTTKQLLLGRLQSVHMSLSYTHETPLAF